VAPTAHLIGVVSLAK